MHSAPTYHDIHESKYVIDDKRKRLVNTRSFSGIDHTLYDR